MVVERQDRGGHDRRVHIGSESNEHALARSDDVVREVTNAGMKYRLVVEQLESAAAMSG